MTMRLVSWWIKWEDLNWPNHDSLDRIHCRADQAANSGASGAIIFGTHFRWDYLPYWTLLHDYIATVAEELHQRNLQLFDHHSASLIHRYDTVEEMRHVMLHSGPHLPFSPDRTAAASWKFGESYLNDWRMINTQTGNILYFPQYAAEGFCHRNPDFIAAYSSYVKRLICSTGIDGLMADDAIYYMRYWACGCKHCRAEFHRRTGRELPVGESPGFWGNWENPDWHQWIDLRYESSGNFYRAVRTALPENFLLAGCGPGSSQPGCNGAGLDIREFLKGCNWVHLELCGNTPPYQKDKATWNRPLSHHLIAASHHLTAAQDAGAECFGGGYGFTEATASIIWAANKFLGASCWFSTLKARLGLPDSILATLPDDASPAAKSFHFELQHPELFQGEVFIQAGIYFSYETRNHSYWGNLFEGFCLGFAKISEMLFHAKISTGTVLNIPEDCRKFKVLILPDVLRITVGEVNALRRFIIAGGTVIAGGPCGFPGCASPWILAEKVSAKHGFWELKAPDAEFAWMYETVPDQSGGDGSFREVEKGVFYTPSRLHEERVSDAFLRLIRQHASLPPLVIEEADGYYGIIYETSEQYILHLLAADYKTEVDEKLDAMRFHRSRVNLITKVEVLNVSHSFTVKTPLSLTVHSPIGPGAVTVGRVEEGWRISTEKSCAYLIIAVDKK